VAARPFWNSAILAPRFLASAFCSGPAILLILFQILRRTTAIEIKDEAIWKIAELMAYAMFLNLFLFGAEIFREYYSATQHLIHSQYLFSGVHGHDALVPFAWASLTASVIAFLLFLFPATRRNLVTLNLGCLLIYFGVYIEKGMALVIRRWGARVRTNLNRASGAKYVPDLNRSSTDRRFDSRSAAYSSALTLSTPTAPLFRVCR
jgi:molybdopterin-containing oxidoreductase family membrane subunit